MTRKRIEILVETERELVITRRRDAMTFCPRCNRELSLIFTEEAATQGAVTVYSSVDTGNETADEGLLVCEMSLEGND